MAFQALLLPPIAILVLSPAGVQSVITAHAEIITAAVMPVGLSIRTEPGLTSLSEAPPTGTIVTILDRDTRSAPAQNPDVSAMVRLPDARLLRSSVSGARDLPIAKEAK